MIPHIGPADNNARVLVVEHSEATHTRPQLICVLPRPKRKRDGREVKRERGELVELNRAHPVAVVIRIVALRLTAVANTPWANIAPLVANLPTKAKTLLP